jgi:uncharacterized protein (DUF1501 family)
VNIPAWLKSIGTDHGTASVMFLLGGRSRAGCTAGRQTDFRSVYATVLKKWLNADPQRTLDSQFPPLGLFA